MKAQYNREDDVLMIYLGEGAIEHAEETDGIIVHFTAKNQPVLIEILDASEFLSRLIRLTAHAESGQAISV
jgi:uncharacterized protein YuzE